MSTSAALLELQDARIAARGGALAPALSLIGAGPRLVLVGAFAPLFALLSGEATLASGSARLLGEDARSAVPRVLTGLALCDPALPLRWTAERYLVESGELAGFGARDARRSAIELLQRFELAARGRHELKDLPLVERRALVLAGATLGNPRVLVAQAPLARLDSYSQSYLHGALMRAAEGRQLIVSVPALPASGPERGLVDAADQVLYEHPSAAPQRAEAAGPRRITLAVLAEIEALTAALSERAIRFEPLPADPLLLALAGANPYGAGRLLVELPPGADTRPLLELADAVQAPLVELIST